MKKQVRLLAAAGIVLLLALLRPLLPARVEAARSQAAAALSLDQNASAALRAIGSGLFSARTRAPEQESTETPNAAFLPVWEREAEVPAGPRQYAEEAVSAGESGYCPEVAAFLARQSPYLPEHPMPADVEPNRAALPFAAAAPVAGHSAAGFGYRTHPILGEVRFHYGTDIAADAGEDILAFADGIVTFSGPAEDYGNYLVLDHGDGWTSHYAHCSYLYAEVGQRVTRGEKVALVGATGLVTGPHLHFELRRDGIWYNPEYYINE